MNEEETPKGKERKWELGKVTVEVAWESIQIGEFTIKDGIVFKGVSVKLGAEYRVQRYADVGVQNGSGSYTFTRGWTSSNPQVDDRNTGNAIASYLLTDPNSTDEYAEVLATLRGVSVGPEATFASSPGGTSETIKVI